MTDDTILLTPGPLTTSARVKRAMLRDWGSRDPEFEAETAFVRAEVLRIANAPDDAYTMVPLQGSGTFAVEAMIASLVAPDDGALVLVNGAYGRRIADICARLRLRHQVLAVADDRPCDPAAVATALAADPSLRHVLAVHCETTSGLLNPIAEIAGICRDAGRELLIDSMSGFGALPVDARALGFAALAASSNKCLQGAPGLGFVIARRSALSRKDHTCPSIVLDLAAQDRQFSADGQWRFTPPTHVVAAFAEALRELADEGGPAARLARYAANCDILIDGMAGLGFRIALDRALQAPIIVSFDEPGAPWFDFERFYDALKARGFAIYAGKMRARQTFRIGVIGAIDAAVMRRFLLAAAEVQDALQAPH